MTDIAHVAGKTRLKLYGRRIDLDENFKVPDLRLDLDARKVLQAAEGDIVV